VRRVTDTKTVDRERTVTGGQGDVDVAVVIVVVVQIPVGLVEANTVTQQLDRVSATAGWLTVLRRDVVGTLECLVAFKKLRAVVLAELVEASYECADVEVAFDWYFLELSLSRGDRGLDHKVGALSGGSKASQGEG